MVAVPETVTVVDPRHPLYDQTFPLLHLTNKQNLVPCCLVRLAEGAERLIPINVTNLAMTDPNVFPSPLSISSLHNLSQTFARIWAQVERECADGKRTGQSIGAKSHNTRPGLDNIDPQPTKGNPANNCSDMSTANHSTPEPGGQK
jgi:hypothetical protein